MTEIVFSVLAEGGSLSIERIRNLKGEKFIYHHSEFDPSDEGLGVNENGEYSTFEQAFQLIHSKYPWFQLHLEKVHEEYRKYVIEELIKTLKFQGVTPDELYHSKSDLEASLNIQLKFGHAPIQGNQQKIIIKNLIKYTDYEHHEYKENWNNPSTESKFVPKVKFETWLAGDQSFKYEQCNVSSEIVDSLETVGKLEVSGNTIIIKNEFDQIEYAFSSDKFFVTTRPILSKTYSWFYTSN